MTRSPGTLREDDRREDDRREDDRREDDLREDDRREDSRREDMAEQVVLVDVGNTHTAVGVLVAGELDCQLRLSTDEERTADEYVAILAPLLARYGIDPSATTGCMVSSVVPPLDSVMADLAWRLFEIEARFVGPGIKTGMSIRYDNPSDVGADRIVKSLAARERYGSPVVVVDLGTATTFDVVGAGGDYLGGLIAPGLDISAAALSSQASRLYRVDLKKPGALIGQSTTAAIQSGLYYGYLSLVDGILERLKAELSNLEEVVVTGARASLLAEASRHIRHVDENLTLAGLQLIYERNRSRRSF